MAVRKVSGEGNDGHTNDGKHIWEEEYKRSWDLLKEDSNNSLSTFLTKQQKKLQLSKRVKATTSNKINPQRGIIRHLFIILDLSSFMAVENLDLKPNRLLLTLQIVEGFITEFFEENPLSCLGIILMRNGLSETISPLSSSPQLHLQALSKRHNREPSGEASLQNSLESALHSLSHIPAHSSKEILIILSSLTSTDPGNIFDTIGKLKERKVRTNIVGLGSRVEVCKKIAHETNGTYTTPLNETHYKNLIHTIISPPPLTITNESQHQLIQMGFPNKIQFQEGEKGESAGSLCVCSNHDGKIGYAFFTCPRCGSFSCSIPTDCGVCGLTLVSSSLLARSYHHLFPVKGYVETKLDQVKINECFSCQTSFNLDDKEEVAFICEICENGFCLDCDLFVHESLHNCPGCLC